jgi:hypothetical protein
MQTHKVLIASGTAPTVLDIEASGFGRASYPIEVGFVLPSGRTYCALVRPEAHWTHWDEAAAQIHHIPRLLIEEKGVPARKIAQELNHNLAGQTVYSDGWVNDYSWLGTLFEAAQLRPYFKLESLRSLLTDAQAEQWHKVKASISAERGAQRHRASADARLLQLTLLRIRQQT